MGLLAPAFGADVIEPVRLHVQAKRYLVTIDARHTQTLTAASAHTFGLQGGAMLPDELQLFKVLPDAPQTLALRRWDDLAKQPGRLQSRDAICRPSSVAPGA